MEPLVCKGTEITLDVRLDKENQIFELSGKSRPENVMEFFNPIFTWFEAYAKDPNEDAKIIFNLEYFNSSTAKVLLKLMIKLDEYYKQGVKMEIVWQCREYDEDMIETGEDYESLIEVPFTYETIKD